MCVQLFHSKASSTEYEFVFNKEDLSHVNGGFCWVAGADGQKNDVITFYIDEIWVTD